MYWCLFFIGTMVGMTALELYWGIWGQNWCVRLEHLIGNLLRIPPEFIQRANRMLHKWSRVIWWVISIGRGQYQQSWPVTLFSHISKIKKEERGYSINTCISSRLSIYCTSWSISVPKEFDVRSITAVSSFTQVILHVDIKYTSSWNSIVDYVQTTHMVVIGTVNPASYLVVEILLAKLSLWEFIFILTLLGNSLGILLQVPALIS